MCRSSPRAGLNRRALVACLLLIGSAACGPRTVAAVPSGPGILAVVAWNMHGGRGDLPRLLADLDAGRLTDRPAANRLLLLQEAVEGGDHDVGSIAALRGWSAFFAPVRAIDRGTLGNAILSSAPLVEARRIALPEERQPRAAAVASVRVGSQPLLVVSVHLENRVSWWKGGPLGDTARGRQAKALLHALPAGAPGILGGDLNTWLGRREPAWRAMAERFDDTPAVHDPTFRDRAVLDHLFFDLPTGWRGTTQVARDAYGSDHLPVIGLITAEPVPVKSSPAIRHDRD
jgi:endonuclease/exonuclease/phosphatase family metal-dependent hydrolase